MKRAVYEKATLVGLSACRRNSEKISSESVQNSMKIVEKYIHESLVVLTNDVIRQEVLKMFNMPFPLNCFFRSQVKFKWVEILKEHFIKTNFKQGY